MKNSAGVAYSFDLDPLNPQLNLNSYYGDLGLDKGVPQNVYNLDVKNLNQLKRAQPARRRDHPRPRRYLHTARRKRHHQLRRLKRYIGVDIRSTPGQTGVLIFALLAVTSLMVSLYVNRRRVWVRTGTHYDGRTMVEYGLLARGEDHRLATEATAIGELLSRKWQPNVSPGDPATAHTLSSTSKKDQ